MRMRPILMSPVACKALPQLSTAAAALRGPGPSHYTAFRDTPQSVGLLWSSDQPDSETST
jgi:hypothetical protein